MASRQRRRKLAEAAQSAGLGPLVRIHRGHGAGPVVFGLGIVVAVGSVPVAIATIIMRTVDVTTWQWPMLLWSALVGLFFLSVHVGPLPGGRRWVAVADGGLVTWQGGAVRTQTWAEAGSLQANVVCCAGDLQAAIRRRSPVPPWTLRRVVCLTVTAIATAAATWYAAVPIAAHVALGERPLKVAQLARICQGGSAFGRAASYEGAAPHPAVVFTSDGDYGYEPMPDSSADTVQLVGCSALIGEGQPMNNCDYEGGYHRETYQGRYQVEVYEAQTARHVGTFRIDGKGPDATAAECSPSIWVPESGGIASDRSPTNPEDSSYHAHLAPFVDGAPR
ncbi:hypothetical protein [Amycolatopsis sp. SID8362]|uniref:hypothetical protein n=1 Tax=Amycolatopsis sp. SID8362 TaxID=2690346 RepID=UPI001369FE95|nr:hypothetical protein [Amycolatopsis sp. SID8362]NBH03492.1 hypothetical protein [Amycolatopsis sp. SID8362]NED40192.1 hypothetical protein [Amycolatopsis sp. SID8362]